MSAMGRNFKTHFSAASGPDVGARCSIGDSGLFFLDRSMVHQWRLRPSHRIMPRSASDPFEADLIRMHTKEDIAVARAMRKLNGKKPKLSVRHQTELRRMYDTGEYSFSDLAEVLDVSRPTIYLVPMMLHQPFLLVSITN